MGLACPLRPHRVPLAVALAVVVPFSLGAEGLKGKLQTFQASQCGAESGSRTRTSLRTSVFGVPRSDVAGGYSKRLAYSLRHTDHDSRALTFARTRRAWQSGAFSTAKVTRCWRLSTKAVDQRSRAPIRRAPCHLDCLSNPLQRPQSGRLAAPLLLLGYRPTRW